MKKRLQGLVAGILIGIVFTSGSAFAKTGTETIEALYNNIKIYIDGQEIEYRDANGNTVEPFIYNGTTYLPVRAIGEAFGKSVDWDGETKSVYVGEKPGEITYFTDVCPAYEYDSFRYEEHTSSNGGTFVMAGDKYTHGFTVTPYNCDSVISLYNLNGEYDKLTFIAGHVDGSANQELELKFYLDDKLIKSIDLKPSKLPKTYSVDLNGALQLKIEAINDEGNTWEQAIYGIADAIIE